VKVLYGPIMPKEMVRPGSRSIETISKVMPEKVMPRLQHELEQAVKRAKAASGTWTSDSVKVVICVGFLCVCVRNPKQRLN
jgi:hypothetical protein